MEIIDDQPGDTPQPSEELDAQKIRQLTALRRDAIRARSWCLITTGVCLVAALQLLINTGLFVHRTHLWGFWPTAYILFAALACLAARFSFRRAKILQREINRPALEEPQAAPDFSTLSDGSQRWKDLEKLQ